MQQAMTDLYIRTFSFWEHLQDEEKNLLSRATALRHYAAGKEVYQSGDCLGVMLVKKGQLRAYVLSEDGREVTLYRLFPGDVGILSASCALQAVTFEVFVVAEEDTEVLVTSSAAFRQVADANIYVKCFGYEISSSRLSSMLWTLQQILFWSADKRLAMFLLEESGRQKTEQLKLTHEQIARYMGSAREVVSRLMRYFVQEGMVRQGRGYVYLEDKEKLRELAEG